ncbi:MAG: hypothetical protein ABIB71_06680 [Candidatus Woesearchaeota archaeon]
MSLELLQQNAKNLIEAFYQYDNPKSKKDKAVAFSYIDTLLKEMRKSLQEERAK